MAQSSYRRGYCRPLARNSRSLIRNDIWPTDDDLNSDFSCLFVMHVITYNCPYISCSTYSVPSEDIIFYLVLYNQWCLPSVYQRFLIVMVADLTDVFIITVFMCWISV